MTSLKTHYYMYFRWFESLGANSLTRFSPKEKTMAGCETFVTPGTVLWRIFAEIFPKSMKKLAEKLQRFLFTQLDSWVLNLSKSMDWMFVICLHLIRSIRVELTSFSKNYPAWGEDLKDVKSTNFQNGFPPLSNVSGLFGLFKVSFKVPLSKPFGGNELNWENYWKATTFDRSH